MTSSVGTKARKKQSPSSAQPSLPSDRQFERTLLILENACAHVLDTGERHDSERSYWQRLTNIATPVSLALAEYKGPRRFHYHYRHREDDEAILHPVLEPSPVDMLAQVCHDALAQCRGGLVGIQDAALIDLRHLLEDALSSFLLRHKQYKAKAA